MTKNFGQERPLILVIDDEKDLLEEVTTLLAAQNFACRCCTSGKEAVAAVQENPPDLIVCDVNLQGESGLETCQRIRQLPGLADVPVMFLSGAQLPDIIRRNHEAGGIYCLRKPFDPQVLIELIDQALTVPGGMPGRCPLTGDCPDFHGGENVAARIGSTAAKMGLSP